jgi:2-oxo-4-hydroxy-4-carboxy-5-ureidoimidazoline decarboxylase
VTIDQLNNLDQEAFAREAGWVFEHSPWVARRAWLRRPYFSIEDLHGKMTTEVEQASRDEQLALLRAHPDLGSRAGMSSSSTNEQAAAGLDKLNAEEFQRLHRLNKAYTDKFTFPFLFAVKGSDKSEVLKTLERRLESSPEEEFIEALRQVYRIARFRLEAIIEDRPQETR